MIVSTEKYMFICDESDNIFKVFDRRKQEYIKEYVITYDLGGLTKEQYNLFSDTFKNKFVLASNSHYIKRKQIKWEIFSDIQEDFYLNVLSNEVNKKILEYDNYNCNMFTFSYEDMIYFREI